MEDKKLPLVESMSGNDASNSLDYADGAAPVSSYSSTQKDYPIETLEVHAPDAKPGESKTVVSGGDGATKVMPYSRRKAMFISLAITFLVVLLTGIAVAYVVRKNSQNDSAVERNIPTQGVSVDAAAGGVPIELQGEDNSLLVTGDVITRGALKVSSNSFVTVIRTTALSANQTITLPDASGALCVSANNCNYATQAGLAAQAATVANQEAELNALQAQFAQLEIPAAFDGVQTLNGQRGSVTIQGSTNRISVSTSNGILTLTTPQDLDANANVQFNSLTTSASGSITTNSLNHTTGSNLTLNAGTDSIIFNANGISFQFPSTGGVSQVICTNAGNCGGAGATPVLLAPGSAQTDSNSDVSIFINDTGGGNLIQMQSTGIDRLVVANNGNTTVGGSFTVSGLGSGIVRATGGLLSTSTVNLSGTDVSGILGVANGGTGAASLTANGVLIGNGTGTVTSVAAGAPGECFVSTAGAPSWQTCPSATGAAPDDAQYLVLSLDGTLSDERSLALGGNLTAVDGGAGAAYTLNTVQNPTFTTSVTTPLLTSTGALSVTPGGAMTLGATGQAALLQGSTTTITSTGLGNDITLTSADQVILNAGASSTIELQDDTIIQGGISVANNLQVGGNALLGNAAGDSITITGTAVTVVNNLNFDANTLYIDSTNNRVGIGDATPSFTLDVTGDANFVGHVGMGDTSTPSVISGVNIGETFINTDNCVTFGCYGSFTQATANNVTAGGVNGVYGGVGTAAGVFTLPMATSLAAGTITAGAGSTITNAYGVFVQSQTAGVNDYGVYIQGADTYALWVDSGATRLDGTLEVQGGATFGTTSSAGTLTVYDGSSNTGLIQTGALSANRTYTLPDESGTVCLTSGNCSGVGGGIIGSGTADRLAVFTGAGTIGDSSITDDGATVTLNGDVDLDVQGTTITVGAGSTRTGSIALHNSTNNNTVTIQSGVTGASYALTLPTGVGSTNQCLKAQNGTGSLYWDDCEGGGGGTSGVSSVNLLDGALILQGTTNQITVNDNGTDTITLSTPQDIHTGATPTFAGLTLSGALNLGANTLQGTTAVIDFTNFDVASDGDTTIGGTVGIGTAATADQLTIASSAGTSEIVFTGTEEVNIEGGDSMYITYDPTLSSGSSEFWIMTNLGSGVVPVFQLANNGNLTSVGTGTFQGASLTVGTTSQLGSLILNDGSSNTGTIQTDALGGNRTYTLPDADGEICLDNGNCAGVGGGVTSPGGTNGTIAMFTGGQTIDDSVITQSGSVISIAGSLTLTTDLAVSEGGTGASTFTTNGVLYGNGASAIQATSAPTGGQVLLGNASGVPTFTTFSGDVTVSDTGVVAIQADSVALGTDTTGNYVAGITQGNGVAVSGSGSENASVTVALGDLTANWNQTGAFDIVLGNAASELSILESAGATFYGTLDVGDLTGSRTYTLPDSTGTVCLSTGNCAGSGSGVTAGTPGTANRLAVFTAGQDITSSWLLQNASTLELDASRNLSLLGGALTVTGSGSFTTDLQVDGNTTLGNAITDTLTVNATSTFNQNVTLAAQKTIRFIGGTTIQRPASPSEGEVYYDTDTDSLLTYANGKWQGDRTVATKIVAASNSSQTTKDAADYVADGNTGAAADGDQVQINAAISALPAGGGTVYLAEGTYTVDAAISVPSNVTLMGAGTSTVITLPNTFNTTINIIQNSDPTGGNQAIVVRDLRINGNKANQSSGTMHGIYMEDIGINGGSTNVIGVNIERVVVDDMRTDGIHFKGTDLDCNNSMVTNSTIRGVTGVGIFLNDECDHNLISNNVIRGTGSYGIELFNSEYNAVNGNTIDSSGASGVYMTNSAHSNNISDNTITNGTTNGIQSNDRNSTITGNIVRGNANVGIQLDNGADDATITGNVIAANLQHGVWLLGDNVHVTGNSFYDNGDTGAFDSVRVSSATGVRITNNRITDTAGTGYAIHITSSAAVNTYLADNTFSGTGATAINDLGTNSVFASQGTAANGAELLTKQSSTSTSAATEKGLTVTVADTGVVTTGTDTTYGGQINVTRTGATGGTITTYGLDIQATADSAGSGTSLLTGLNVNVSGADTNYAAIFQGGNVGIGTTTPGGNVTGASTTANTMLDVSGAIRSWRHLELTVDGTASGETAFVNSTDVSSYIYSSRNPGSGTGVFGNSGNLVLQARGGTSAADIHLVTGTTTGGTVTVDSRMVVKANGNVGIGGFAITNPSALLHVGDDLTAANNKARNAWGLNGVILQAGAGTYEDGSTAASGTATNAVFTGFNRPTLSATNANVTTTNAATVYIENAPLAGTNQTITNPYALWIDNGVSRFDGVLRVPDGTNSSPAVGFFNDPNTGIYSVGADQFGVTAGGQLRLQVDSSGITVSGDVLPNTSDTRNLGSTSNEFNQLYIGDNGGVTLGVSNNATLAYDAVGDGRVELTGTEASLFIEDRLSLGRQTATMNTAGAATETTIPTASYIEITGQDNAADILTVETSSAKEGDIVMLANIAATTVNIDQTATAKLSGGADVPLTQHDVIMLIFDGTNWLQVAGVTNNS